MKPEFWERICVFRRLYLIFISFCGGLLLMMLLVFPAQPPGSSSQAITIINIGVLSFGLVGGLIVYYWCSVKTRKSLKSLE